MSQSAHRLKWGFLPVSPRCVFLGPKEQPGSVDGVDQFVGPIPARSMVDRQERTTSHGPARRSPGGVVVVVGWVVVRERRGMLKRRQGRVFEAGPRWPNH